MKSMLFVYNGTVGAILASFIKKHFIVHVFEYGLDAGEFAEDLALNEVNDDTVLALVIGQEFPVDVFYAIQRLAGVAVPIVWLCQDQNNHEIPDASVQRHVCNGPDEWLVFTNTLNRYLARVAKK